MLIASFLAENRKQFVVSTPSEIPLCTQHVRLHFVGFDLESHRACSFDSVKVYDGRTNRSPLKGTYCGSRVPADITSSGSAMFVSFTSDSSVTKAGFRIRFQKGETDATLILLHIFFLRGNKSQGFGPKRL